MCVCVRLSIRDEKNSQYNTWNIVFYIGRAQRARACARITQCTHNVHTRRCVCVCSDDKERCKLVRAGMNLDPIPRMKYEHYQPLSWSARYLLKFFVLFLWLAVASPSEWNIDKMGNIVVISHQAFQFLRLSHMALQWNMSLFFKGKYARLRVDFTRDWG